MYDSEVGQRVKSGAMLDMVDASSLLYRLELEGNNSPITDKCNIYITDYVGPDICTGVLGVNVGNRWNELYRIWESHAHDHILVRNLSSNYYP